MIDGILLIDKERDITSYDVIRKLKRILGNKQKIGHAGTLDPFATGLLVILLGKATKLMNTFHTYEKEYEVVGEFGYATDTQDSEGKVIQRSTEPKIPQKEELRSIVEKHFLGNITQVPPIYSAKKIKGRKAYDLARKGKEVILKPVNISISVFEIFEYEYPFFKCKIRCSTGTYVRTLINDLGMRTENLATSRELRRVAVGEYKVSEAIPSTQLVEENIENILRRVININS